jgi:hypothetical protein
MPRRASHSAATRSAASSQSGSKFPAGSTDLAREIAARLGVLVSFACFDAARKSLAVLIAGIRRGLRF